MSHDFVFEGEAAHLMLGKNDLFLDKDVEHSVSSRVELHFHSCLCFYFVSQTGCAGKVASGLAVFDANLHE
jgi:hypothetical protein